MQTPVKTSTKAAWPKNKTISNAIDSSTNGVPKSAANQGERGRATMHGSSYHLRMAMVILLRAFTLRRKGNLSDFKITMEDPNAGKFDDVVFYYSLPSTPKEFACVYIQAKHKLISKTKAKHITEGSLLTKWNSKTPFSIPMYFISYLDGYEISLKGSHTYILCTNASIEESAEKYFTLRKHDSCHILSYCEEIGATCYCFNNEIEFKALSHELRYASIEKLGQTIAMHVKNKRLIKRSTPIFKVFINLIAKCVEKYESGTYQFNEMFWNAEKSTILGKLRNSFKQEYFKLSKTQDQLNPQVSWKDIKIMINQPFSEAISNLIHLSHDENSYFEKVDVIIQHFYEKFLLVCGSMNETELRNKILKMMPNWVNNPKITYNSLHNMLFEGMINTVFISWQDLKQHFLETNVNENFTKVQTFTNGYLSSMRDKYSHIVVKESCLNDTQLNEFISCSSYCDIYRYRCTTNMKMNSLIVSHTLALHQYQCLFVNSESSKFKANISDVICELMEFITDNDISTEYIITILGQLGRDVLRYVKNQAKTYKIKIIIVEEPAEEDLSEDCSFVRDLTDEAKEQLFEKYNNLKLFGTTIALNNMVREDDSLRLLFNVLEKCDDIEVSENENFNLKNFENIKPWYIPRSCVPYTEDKQDSQQFLDENETTTTMLKSIISLKDQTCNLPNVLKYADNFKVHIFLDDAGHGKTTYFTWLASALSNDDSSLFVIRMNALQYSTDFLQLQARDPKTLDDTEIIKILYRLLHLTLFVCNIHNRAIKESDEERQKADRTAQLLKLSNGKIILDESNVEMSKLPLEELLELRLLQHKFNEKQLIVLLDGFDEIAPYYKYFVMRYFVRLSDFEGVRKLFLSTRPYNFRDELKQSFSDCMLWQLEPFSQKDRILFLINFLEHDSDGIKINIDDQSISILENMYTLTTNSIQELKLIPLFLHMAAKVSLSKVKNHLNTQQQTMSFKLPEETKVDQLQIISHFVEEKLKILNEEKTGTIHSASNYPLQRMKNEEVNKQIKRRHNLLGMLVIFNTGVRTRLLSDQEQQEAIEFMRDVAEGNEKTGIIQEVRDGIPRFTHRIIAEYFAACWLYNNKRTMNTESFFRSWTYWSTELHRVRDFLNRMIVRDSEGCDIHMAVINQSEQQVRRLLSTNPSVSFEKDAVGRLPLHLAVIYPSKTIENLFTRIMSLQSINTKDKLFHWTALDYAFAMRYDTSTKNLLAAGAPLNENTLLQQILSNNLQDMMLNAHDYGVWLNSHERYRMIARKLHFDLIDNLINDRQLDIFSSRKELDSLTVVEFCIKHNMIGVFKQLVSQMNIRRKILTELSKPLLQLASDSNAHDIASYLTDLCNMPLLQTNDDAELISALKSSIKQNQMNSFKMIFQQLCYQLKVLIIDDTEIDEDTHEPSNDNIPSLDKDDYPKVCCVPNSDNVRLPLPEYDKKDILHEGYLIEALLARAVHEGNMQMVKYIVQKTSMVITNRLIVMIMRLLPKEEEVCHEKSMSAFIYLLEKTTDRNTFDAEGRNLLHMTAQNGCFFMLHCLIAKGFDPTVINTRNGWNVFHYVAFNQDEDRSDKILEFLLKHGGMNWFDSLNNLVDADVLEASANDLSNSVTKQNSQKCIKLSKQRHALLAMFSIFRKEDLTKLLSDQQFQEAMQCMRDVSEGNEKSDIIKGIQGFDPQFTHRIIAEYFAASWIYSNKHRMRSDSFFRSWTYWNGRVHRTRSLLNRLIVSDSDRCDIHMAVINQSVQQVRELISKYPSATFVKDSVGRLPLHLAVIYPSREIEDYLTNKMPLLSINAKDDLFQWTALDYAFAMSYDTTTKSLLTAGAAVNEDTLLQQILSNNLRVLLIDSYDYGMRLHSRENAKKIANQLHVWVVEYLLNERQLDIFSPSEELDSLTVLEFCTKRNMIGVLKQFLIQMNIRGKILTDLSDGLLQIALENKAHDIVEFLVNECNMMVPQNNNGIQLISALKSSIKQNQMNSFKMIFQQLCYQLKISVIDDTEIDEDTHEPSNDNIPSLDKDDYPKVCCVPNSDNVRLPLPEYDEKDILHEGYLIEALLAKAVHEGNMQMVKYIVQKTSMVITNRLIVMIMRLLPKEEEVCHEKSMSAFIYLLEKTTDRNTFDAEGRNLLHMTAQNGCFVMLHCLIAKGFDPTVINTRNGWNVFHYVAFNQDEDRSDKILEFLLKHGGMNWFDSLNNLVDSDVLEAFANDSSNSVTKQNSQKCIKLSKQRHALLAMFSIFRKEDLTKLLSDQQFQEAMQCMRDVSEGNEKSDIIKGIQGFDPQFTHRIIAEYFAASWIYSNKHRMRSDSFFRSWTYWNGRVHRTRSLLNRLIVSDSDRCDIHMAVINQSVQQVRELISKYPSATFVKDSVGRLPLHLAVIYPSRAIEDYLTNKMPLLSINAKDDLFQWTALDYAFAMSYDTTTKSLLTAGAAVNEDTLLQQILSNNLRDLLVNSYDYGLRLHSRENAKKIANQLHIRLVEYLLNERQLDIFSPLEELDSLTVLEFCTKRNMVSIVTQLVTQTERLQKISSDQSNSLFQIALENKAHDTTLYFIDECNMMLPKVNDTAKLIAVLKSTFEKKHMHSFKAIFQQLCYQLKIRVIDDTEIDEDTHEPSNGNIPSLDKDDYPKVCCVPNSDNVRLPLPEYDEKDILHEGYLIEALLAKAVHEGNMQMVKYIVQKTSMVITNRLIVMIMRLLPKEEEVCHEKSMSAFIYLLEKTTDRNTFDAEGRNLLHMTAQNGCFFMLHCLIAKGFDPTVINTRNGWNVFHYVAFNQDEDRSDKILEFLLKHGGMNWFDSLNNLVDSDVLEAFANDSSNSVTKQNSLKCIKLSKQRHALLAMFSIFRKEDLTKLLSDQQFQEAMQCMRDVSEGNEKSDIIKGIQGFDPQFTHRIIAEYFAASWIYSNKHRMRSDSFFRSWTYWNGRVHRTRSLLNRLIVSDSDRCDIHMAVINQSVQQVRELISKYPSAAFVKDSVGRLPLHLAIINASRAIEKLLIGVMPLQHINMKDELFHWTALDYAFAMRYDTSSLNLLAIGVAVNEDTLLQQILSNDLKDLLVNAHDYGVWFNSYDTTKKISKQLHKRVVEHLINEKQLDIFSPHEEFDSHTVLEFCTKRNMGGLFEQFSLQINFRWTLSTEESNRLLQMAFESKAYDILAYLVGN